MTRHATLGAFEFASGETVPELTLAYETYGSYDGSNAVLVCHALTGSHHVRPPAEGDTNADGPPSSHGWWEEVVAPGGPVDTDEWFVICANVPGSCHGSTAPASPRPTASGSDGGTPVGDTPAGDTPAGETLDGDTPDGPTADGSSGEASPDGAARWGSAFPTVTVGDWTRAQARLLDRLGVDTLAAVIGGSVGGMNALDWAARFPDRVERVAAVASGARLDTECLALNTVARRAITTDPAWHGGDYHETAGRPVDGLAQARRIGHVMYRSKASLDEQFGRDAAGRTSPLAAVDPTSDAGTYRAVESYLDYNAERFARAFDAGSYLRLLRAMDEYDLARVGSGGSGDAASGGSGDAASGRSDDAAGGVEGDAATAAAVDASAVDGAVDTGVARALAGFDGDLCLVSYTGDWHFPVAASETVADAARAAGVDVTHHTVVSEYGHDAFLADQSTLVDPLSALLADDAGTDRRRRAGGSSGVRSESGREASGEDRVLGRSSVDSTAPVHSSLYGR
ncbi:alpha/beta fold hydrolase family protein [Halobaculum sp. MBLA0147]|uniref:homoserine O-acetyltransferase family protein n=1 Tax=Halobaculum sp. MBLA0147 TaxID=3079934 RepID=UPI003523F702